MIKPSVPSSLVVERLEAALYLAPSISAMSVYGFDVVPVYNVCCHYHMLSSLLLGELIMGNKRLKEGGGGEGETEVKVEGDKGLSRS